MFKLRVYDRFGNLDHEECFESYPAALQRWARLFDQAAPWLSPTIWEKQGDEFVRVWG